MKCPKCDVDLEKSDLTEAGFVTLDVCPGCRGTWFDEGELDQLDDSISTSAEELELVAAEGDHAALSCPKCEGPLEALSPTDARDLVIDRCDACKGFWLDDGELERVREALLDSDSSANEGATLYARPPGWSLWRWSIYCLTTTPKR